MTKPIVLYDQNHERVGETYPRRAKQLVKSGRAFWLEDGLSLQMAPAPDEHPLPHAKEDLSMSETIYQNNGMPHEEPTAYHEHEGTNDLLMYLPKKNVAEKRSLLRHVIAWLIIFAVAITFPTYTTHVWTSSSAANVEDGPVVRSVYEFAPEMQAQPRLYAWTSPGNGSGVFRIPQELMFSVGSYEIVFPNIARNVEVIEVTTTTQNHNALWHFFLGVMTAWGVWIAARSVKLLRRNMQSRGPKAPRPDPVALEYQRLKATM